MKDKEQEKKANLGSVHKAGRKTKIMLDKYVDLAKLANEKLIDTHRNPEQQEEALKELLACLDIAVEKSHKIPMGKQLQKIIKRLVSLSDDLDLYIHDNFG